MKKVTILLAFLLSVLCGQTVFAEGKTSFPIELSSENGLPGTLSGDNYVWTSPVYELEAPINGIRVTFFESQGTPVFYNGFPVVALAELKLFDGDGNQIEYTVDNVSTNSLENYDGALEYICDGDVKTHYHSTWSNGTTPEEYVYVDIEFPAEVSSFQYVQVSRNNKALMPSKISITPVGVTGNFTFKGTVSGNISWSFALNSGELSIGGTGAMPDFRNTSEMPWYDKRSLIKKVVIGDGVTYIGKYSFYNYDQLQDVCLSNSVTSIGVESFYDCDNLKNIEFGKDLNQISNYAFYSCDKLKNIEFGENISLIGERAFSECSSLESVAFSDSSTPLHIGNHSFYNCDALKEIVLCAGVNEMAEYAFGDCGNLRKVVSKAAVPPAIKSNTFNYSPISSVYVPSGSGNAYSAASYWNNFLIIDGEGLAVEVTLTQAGTLGEKLLEQVEYLNAINILKVTGPINDDDLYNIKQRMPNLIEIDLEGVERDYLQEDLFRDRVSIRKVTLPKVLRWVADDMFYNCPLLEEVILPGTLVSIGSYSFYKCQSLKEIVIPEGVTNIGSQAFYYCTALERVSLPSTLSVINSETFCDCRSLKNIEFSDGLTSIGNNAFYNCVSIETLEMPSTLKLINREAFYNCTSLKSVSLNEGLEDLRYAAFYNCDGLREIVLPGSIMICDRVFRDCNNLVRVVSLSLMPPFLNGSYSIFDGASMASRVLYVPVSTVNKYKLARGWDAFTRIEGINELPQNIYIHNAETFTWPDSLNAGYKPNISLDALYIDNYNRYGSLVVDGDGTISTGKFAMLYHPSYYYDYSNYSTGYSALVNNATMRADEIYIELSVKTNRWNFISFPFDVKVSEIVPLLANTNYVIRKYSGAARANADFDNTWQDMTLDSVLHAGEGYILQCNRFDNNGYSQSYSDFGIKAVNNANKNRIFANDDVTVALGEYLSEFGHNRSWNLVGNPYPCFYDTRFMDFTAPITVWNERNSTYSAYSPLDDEFILRPGEAFFVQCPVGAEGVLFASEGRQVNAAVRQMSAKASAANSASVVDRMVFNIVLSQNGTSDRTRFVINKNASFGYETNCDASKFLSNDVTVPQIYTVEDDVIFAINERPLGNGTVKLGTYIYKKGDYTISLDTKCGSKIILSDKFTGIETDLSTTSYSFNSDAGFFDDRFEIIIKPELTSVEEAIDELSRIYVIGGDIVVKTPEVADIEIYSADGRLVSKDKSTDVQVTAAPGVYVVKVAGKAYKVAVSK